MHHLSYAGMKPYAPIGHHLRCDCCDKPMAVAKKCFRCSKQLCGECTTSRGGLLFCPKCYSPETREKKPEKRLLAFSDSDVKDAW